jgi:hypothetical protein
MVVERESFTLAAVWEQIESGRDAAIEWAGRHIKLLYEDAIPVDLDDPRGGTLT